MNRNVWRRFKSNAALSIIYALTGLALVPLGLVLWYTILKGLPAASHPEFYLNVERPVGIPGSGISHAIVGTAMMVGMASLIAIPVGVISGVYLAEYGHARWARWVRLASDVLVGALVGTGIGVAVPALHTEQFQVAPLASSNGAGLTIAGGF